MTASCASRHGDVRRIGGRCPCCDSVGGRGPCWRPVEPAGSSRAVAIAATPSPRPVRPRPSVVVPDTATGAPTASESTRCASARRVPIRGALPITWTAALPTRQPAAATSLRTSASNVTPLAPAHSGRPVPNTAPTSPRPAAESRASQRACAATSPSEWPAHPSTPGHSSPAIQHGRPRSTGCTSDPMPTLTAGAPPARDPTRCARRRRAGRPAPGARRSRPARPTHGDCTTRSPSRSGVPRTKPSASTRLTVSVSGNAGTAASCPPRTAATTAATSPGGVSGRRASCTSRSAPFSSTAR